jgi:hypothetical protein
VGIRYKGYRRQLAVTCHCTLSWFPVPILTGQEVTSHTTLDCTAAMRRGNLVPISRGAGPGRRSCRVPSRRGSSGPRTTVTTAIWGGRGPVDHAERSGVGCERGGPSALTELADGWPSVVRRHSLSRNRLGMSRAEPNRCTRPGPRCGFRDIRVLRASPAAGLGRWLPDSRMCVVSEGLTRQP